MMVDITGVMVAKGKEYVFITSLDQQGKQQLMSYDENKDIEFFKRDISSRHLLVPNKFMVFFPSNPHQPGMKVDSVETVRKIVVKVHYVK